ncbi:8-amino-7-oxononanoate synthase [Acinetobacter sp. MD2(2019)]|uniref:8-amino-7-oxononanoate synthase n=1 Tax=Acinetobacter sp. MD2(2019) TaxID=2605273 RepID=UPI002D1E8F06|nr:8-amino-7-oxononanoate synthase [Acinetobacter sp. MD2(2019)]MEB3753945.1 8-amino-7-oxononanoate synthase [Acinetobacter sp. MD2(2019)]
MALLDHYAAALAQLKQQGNYRQFTDNTQFEKMICVDGQQMLNLSSNDYLGLANQQELRTQFFQQLPMHKRQLTTSSSRLLTGNYPEYSALEQSLSQAFLGRSALLFNSGYHMNIGILPALADSKTLILADKLIHASMIDGIRLSSAKYVRYRHNDLSHLQQLIEKYHDDAAFERIIVVTESIFSMDGDETDLAALAAIKAQFAKVMLYVDEAHAIGVRGEKGLGCAEQYAVIDQIDFLVGTFGKAIASMGGYLICDEIIKAYLINSMRPLIFSTALPPINIAWTQFIFEHMQTMHAQRQHLQHMSQYLQQQITALGYSSPSTSHLVPIVISESRRAVEKAKALQAEGFYIMPVRPPTVPQNSARLRVSLNAQITQNELQQLVSRLV